jgi:hypothetical protein
VRSHELGSSSIEDSDAYDDEVGAREKIRNLMLLDRQRGRGMLSCKRVRLEAPDAVYVCDLPSRVHEEVSFGEARACQWLP